MGVKFFKRNKIDQFFTQGSITVTDGIATNPGQDFAYLLRNRNNTSGWMTTGSTDAGNTTLIADMGEGKDLDKIILVNHNFKAFTIKYWNGASYVDFSPAISQTVNTETVSIYSFASVSTTKIRIIITAAQVLNADKRMTQLIMTEQLGELACQPMLTPKIDRSRKVNKFLSGRVFISKSVPSFEVKLKMNTSVTETDLALVETLYDSFESFLVWLSGGDVAQFGAHIRQGYRLQDFYLVNLDAEYVPEYKDGRWPHGVPINLSLQETN